MVRDQVLKGQVRVKGFVNGRLQLEFVTNLDYEA